MDPLRNDFLTQYKAISAKLKKRFLRKPNIAEASAQFGMLAKELENQECPHYSAFCCLAVARCEQSIGNSIGESQNLLQAARLFLEAEQLNHELLCPGFSENLQAAVSAYNHCIKVYLENDQYALAASLNLEVGQSLQHLNRADEALSYYIKAAELHSNCPVDYIQDLKFITQCRWKTSDFDGALSALTVICVMAEQKGIKENGERLGVYSSILCEAEISRLFLLLLLKPPKIKLQAEQIQLLEKYSNIYSDPPDYMEEDLFLLLQSLMIAVNDKDDSALVALENDLSHFLTTQQYEILHRLIIETRDLTHRL